MANDNDEATNAMIASLLAQDQGAYQEEILEEAGQDDSEDEDYGGTKKRKRQSRKGGRAGLIGRHPLALTLQLCGRLSI